MFLTMTVYIFHTQLHSAGAKPGTHSLEWGRESEGCQPALDQRGRLRSTLSNSNSNFKIRPSLPRGQMAATYGSEKTSLTAEEAKNHRAKSSCLQNLHVGTLNVRTLRDDGRLEELLLELENIKWDIIGLCEIRRKDERLLDIKHEHQLYYRGTPDGRNSGVGFIINKTLKNKITSYNSLLDRVASVTIKLLKRYILQIIQVYAPTSSHSDKEVEEFYELMTQQLKEYNHHFKIVMRNFNAKVGEKQQFDTMIRPYGFDKSNDRGSRLVNFAEKEHLSIMNTYFKKRSCRKWTWKSPKYTTSEIDYILSNHTSIFTDCSVINRFDIGTDHRPLRTT